jgi:hypothetical protein
MREIRLSGSEGGGDELNRLSLPLSWPRHSTRWLPGTDLAYTRTGVSYVVPIVIRPSPLIFLEGYQNAAKEPRSRSQRACSPGTRQ